MFRILLLLTGVFSIFSVWTVSRYIYLWRKRGKSDKRYLCGAVLSMLVAAVLCFGAYTSRPVNTFSQDAMSFDDVCYYAAQGKSVTGDGVLSDVVYQGMSEAEGKQYYVFRGSRGVLVTTADNGKEEFSKMVPGHLYLINCEIMKTSNDKMLGVVVWGKLMGLAGKGGQ